MPVRSIATYLVSVIFVVLALDSIAPPVGLGLAAGNWPKGDPPLIVETVNRLHKGDRLSIPTTSVGKQLAPHQSPEILVGCEAVYSPLSASTKGNFNRPNLLNACVV